MVANSTPTGRTADKHGRFHGAANYLNSTWTVLRSSRSDTNKRPSFSSAFNEALSSAGLQTLHPDVPLRWLRELFGATKKVDGCYVPSDKYTTLDHHNTDACSTCCFYAADLRQARQCLKRHLQQPDQATMERIDAVSGVRRIIYDLETALDGHKAEANRDISYHKTCVSGATQRYERLATQFQSVLDNMGAMDMCTQSPLCKEEEELCLSSSMEWHVVSSDHQQDKLVPSWNESPQPGPTYFMSGEAHYVHIFCAESCGYPTVPPHFSRNLVYCRSERVGGSKSSVDTLSTLADVLLGGPAIGTEVPPLYRSGYGPEGLLQNGDARASPFDEP